MDRSLGCTQVLKGGYEVLRLGAKSRGWERSPEAGSEVPRLGAKSRGWERSPEAGTRSPEGGTRRSRDWNTKVPEVVGIGHGHPELVGKAQGRPGGLRRCVLDVEGGPRAPKGVRGPRGYWARLECVDRGSRSRDGVPRGLEDEGYDDKGSEVVGLGKD